MPCALDQHRTSALGVSKDSFYAETHPNTMPIEHELLETWRAWERGGVMATDMRRDLHRRRGAAPQGERHPAVRQRATVQRQTVDYAKASGRDLIPGG